MELFFFFLMDKWGIVTIYILVKHVLVVYLRSHKRGSYESLELRIKGKVTINQIINK